MNVGTAENMFATTSLGKVGAFWGKSHLRKHSSVKYCFIHLKGQNRLISPWKPGNWEERFLSETNDGTAENMFALLKWLKVFTSCMEIPLKNHLWVKYCLVCYQVQKDAPDTLKSSKMGGKACDWNKCWNCWKHVCHTTESHLRMHFSVKYCLIYLEGQIRLKK